MNNYYAKYVSQFPAAFHPPFAFEDPDQLSLVLTDDAGKARVLEYGADFMVLNGDIFVSHSGHAILEIFLKAAPTAQAPLRPEAIAAPPGDAQTTQTAQAQTAQAQTTRAAQAAIQSMNDPFREPLAQIADLQSDALTSIARSGDEERARLEKTGERIFEDMRRAASSLQAREAIASQNAGLAADFKTWVQKLADHLYHETARMMDIARQISVHRQRPGIAAVASIERIPRASAGLFIVNPHITHAPTPFMGIWPVSCIGQMAFDGVFFLGKPYEPAVKIPVPDPRPPRFLKRETAQGDGDDWIPCDHSHTLGHACAKPQGGCQCP